jgi:hypothetical protein
MARPKIEQKNLEQLLRIFADHCGGVQDRSVDKRDRIVSC